MGKLISLQERRDAVVAEEHARALVLFECAAILARRRDSGLMHLVNEAFGADEIERRIQATLSPRRRDEVDLHPGQIGRKSQKAPSSR